VVARQEDPRLIRAELKGTTMSDPEQRGRTLKPFTSYVCPVGAGQLGHSSLWTGAYREANQRASDGTCMCGAEMIEEAATRDGSVYRLEFETCDPLHASRVEAERGRGVWPFLSAEEWEALPWYPASRESDAPAGLMAQYRTLQGWAATREQPIRNVRLMKAAAPTWTEVVP
jgi:hypothetical protein